MKANCSSWRRWAVGGLCALLGAGVTWLGFTPRVTTASPLPGTCWPHLNSGGTYCGSGDEPPNQEVGGAWYWLRSPEQEKRVVIALFNRYCVRCHGVDGRGVWDIPDVPNFTNARWQAVHTDGQLARSILEGRGSVMPPWRGALSLEEAWALARYVRTLVPGTEISRPDVSAPAQTSGASQPPARP